MFSTVDLHLHTTASDGTCTPPELLALLRDRGIRTFAITDHDNIDGAVAMLPLVPPDMRYLPGVEFTCYTAQGDCHILGYGYDPADSLLQDALAEGRRLRFRKLEERIRYLNEAHDIRFTPDELHWLRNQPSPAKPHLAKLLLNRGLGTEMHPLIRQYINPYKGSEDRITAAMAIQAILHAGGTPVWAHPLGGEGKQHLTPKAFRLQLHVLLPLGLQGLECWYSRYTQAEAAFLMKEAQANHLLTTGGSDFHGLPKPGLWPGQLCCEEAAPAESDLTLLT